MSDTTTTLETALAVAKTAFLAVFATQADAVCRCDPAARAIVDAAYDVYCAATHAAWQASYPAEYRESAQRASR